MKTSFLYLFFFLFLPFSSFSQIITTYAGNGTMGYLGDGGAATNAELDGPMGINFDSEGNLLIGTYYDLVRKVNVLTGTISTIAGDTSAILLGNGGSATAALINHPYNVCTDNSGNIYIADFASSEIRKVDISTGLISAYAGNDTAGYKGDGGPATNAELSSYNLAIDTLAKFCYIADEYNYRVRRIDMTTGIITTFAGTGVSGYSGDGGHADSAKLSRVLGLGIDRFGNLYIGEYDNARIRKVDAATGIITTFAGTGTGGYSGDSGLATNAKISEVSSICFDTCGNLYFADGGLGGGNNRIRKIDAASGIISTVAGNGTSGFSGDSGLATEAEISRPTGLCFDKFGNLYISDIGNNRIRKVTFSIACDDNPLNANQINTNTEVTIYPNPITTTFTITASNKITQVTITNLMGQIVTSQKYNAEKVEVDTGKLAVGVYVVRVTDDTGQETIRKVVKTE